MTRVPADPGPWIAGLESAGGPADGVVPVQQKRDRQVWRVDLDGRTGFVKRGVRRKRAELRREAANLADLAAAGVPVPELLAAGERDGAEWLVMASAGGAPLSEVLAAGAPAVRLRERLRATAEAVRKLHDAGWAHPDLTAPHVFVDGAGATLIDVARAHRIGRRADSIPRDLAALLFSLPRHAVGRVARVRLLRDATGLRGADLRASLPALHAALAKLELRTRWRHAHLDACGAVRAFAGSDGEVFDALLAGRGMTRVRTLADRENRRFETASGDAYFVKVYPPTRRGHSPAQRERAAIDRFARAGIPTCREAAYGEDVDRGSFLIVAGCAGEPLDDLLRRGVTLHERRALCRETARLFRRMRAAGLRHRDAYACHVFVARRAAPAPDGSLFDLRLIDMTRAGAAPFPRERWFVKDAAQLWHGVPREVVTRTDACRWLREYAELPKLDTRAKRFARRVAAKERRMAARQQRKRAREE